MGEAGVKIFLGILFFPFVVIFYVCKFIIFLFRRNREITELAALERARAERDRPAQPTVIDMPVSSRNTLYGSQQPDD